MPDNPAATRIPTNGRDANLAVNLDQRLLGYASAASAAGVGLLALAQPAEAKIIYTPANIPIVERGPNVLLDVNNDGVADFSFYNAATTFAARKNARPPLGGYAHVIGVAPTVAESNNEVGAITSFLGGVCAAEVAPNRRVGNGDNFQPGVLDLFAVAGDYTSPGTPRCPWQGRNNKGGFLALKFIVSGQTYYGWAHISLTGTNPTITGYAYENTPGGSIKTGQTHGPAEQTAALPGPEFTDPQPATLGALANGALGLAIWRRPEEVAAN